VEPPSRPWPDGTKIPNDVNDEELRRYGEAAAAAPVRDRADEMRFVSAAKEGDGEAREQFLGAHARLVISIARRYAESGRPLGSLVEAGDLGLARALDQFDPARGLRFPTYATGGSGQAITREIAGWQRRQPPSPGNGDSD
jgi:RNA polymerase primary sigma factor